MINIPKCALYCWTIELGGQNGVADTLVNIDQTTKRRRWQMLISIVCCWKKKIDFLSLFNVSVASEIFIFTWWIHLIYLDLFKQRSPNKFNFKYDDFLVIINNEVSSSFVCVTHFFFLTPFPNLTIKII